MELGLEEQAALHSTEGVAEEEAVPPAGTAAGLDGADDEEGGFEFGSDAAASDSSSWSSSEEETTDAPIDRDSLPAWIKRRHSDDSRCVDGRVHGRVTFSLSDSDEEAEGKVKSCTPTETLARKTLRAAVSASHYHVQAYASPVVGVDESEAISPAGTVCSVVGQLVVVQVTTPCISGLALVADRCVQAPVGQTPLDDGSVLCFADRVLLGIVCRFPLPSCFRLTP